MNNERQIAKQLFDKHCPFKDSPVAWTAWKMAFQFGLIHQRDLQQASCSSLRDFLAQMQHREFEAITTAKGTAAIEEKVDNTNALTTALKMIDDM